MKKISLAFLVLLAAPMLHAESADSFNDAEANFKLAMQKILNQYVDKKLTRDDLYRAATAGMLSSLNNGNENSNKLLTPSEIKEMQEDFKGKVTGIGVTIKFDEPTGYATVFKLIPQSPAEKAGIKDNDQILSVDGKKYKGKTLKDLAFAIRGEAGKSVNLKILREDQVLDIKVKREALTWSPVDYWKVNEDTGLLAIGYFTENTPELVDHELRGAVKDGIKRLVVDLRDSEGGGFDAAIKVAELFLPKDAVVASTTDRNGEVKTYRSKGGLLPKDMQLVVLTNKGTFCGSELVAAALRDGRKAKLVGETTFGKWNAQVVEPLENNFAIKYTVSEFRSPAGQSFQGKGLKPDVEIPIAKELLDPKFLSAKYQFPARLDVDAQLRAAIELVKSI